MSSIRSTILSIASAAAIGMIALAPPLDAAPTAEQQDAGTPAVQPGAGKAAIQHGGCTDTMQHDNMDAEQHGNTGMMQHGNTDMMQHGSMDMMQHHQEMMTRMHSMHGGGPTLPGQDAFGAIGEIVALLEADPKTDWSKVDIEALRAHLIDMNEVMLNANVATKPVEGGIEVAVTGAGRTLAAIQRMVPMHATEIDGGRGWRAKTSPLPYGVLLAVTASDPKEVAHIRGLGFAGLMVEGSHHQAHHLAIAKGEPMHSAGADHAQHAH